MTYYIRHIIRSPLKVNEHRVIVSAPLPYAAIEISPIVPTICMNHSPKRIRNRLRVACAKILAGKIIDAEPRVGKWCAMSDDFAGYIIARSSRRHGLCDEVNVDGISAPTIPFSISVSISYRDWAMKSAR